MKDDAPGNQPVRVLKETWQQNEIWVDLVVVSIDKVLFSVLLQFIIILLYRLITFIEKYRCKCHNNVI